MLHGDDSQRRFLAQHRVAKLEQCCNYSKQCRNAVLICAKNRWCESSCVTSPLYVYVYDRNSRKKSFRGIKDKVIILLLNLTLGKHK